METLKAMGMEHRAAENWSNLFVDSLNISVKRGRLDAVFSFLQSLLSTLSILAIMFYGTYLVLGGAFTLWRNDGVQRSGRGFFLPLDQPHLYRTSASDVGDLSRTHQ